MLQALKNLEARSSRPAAERPRPPVPVKAPPSPVAQPVPEPSSEPPPSVVRATAPIAETPEVLLKPQRRLAPAVAPVDLPTSSLSPPEGLFGLNRIEIAPTLAPPRTNDANAESTSTPLKPAQTPPGRAATVIERQIRRTLSDPIRSRPLRELAERLYRDAQQTKSKTIAVVGLGGESATHDTLLYVATLLAERVASDMVLVDADLARRELTEALEAGQQAGLGELIAGSGNPRQSCQSTAVNRLLFLPAGPSRHTDLSAVGSRLEEVLSQLRTEFSLVLIDAGRAADLAASALARLADATYFVVRLGAVETSEAQSSLASFRAAGARVLGCIAT
jgi:Mrp family chromosome partitioning ATPase